MRFPQIVSAAPSDAGRGWLMCATLRRRAGDGWVSSDTFPMLREGEDHVLVPAVVPHPVQGKLLI